MYQFEGLLLCEKGPTNSDIGKPTHPPPPSFRKRPKENNYFIWITSLIAYSATMCYIHLKLPFKTTPKSFPAWFLSLLYKLGSSNKIVGNDEPRQ